MLTVTKNGWKMWVSVFLASGLLFGGMVAPVLAAVEEYPAAAPQPTTDGDSVKHFYKGVLMRTFRYQESMTTFIGVSLENASDSVSRAEARIEELIEKGKDVTELEEAVVQFETLIEEAKNACSAAQSLVDLHCGFDDKGRVEDLAEAWETINAIEPYLSAARGNIVEAVRVVNEAVQVYQTANEI
jgi:hypothetical protein